MKIGLKKGFTLIELLIVIAIIGILAVALLPTILGAPAKGRDAARKAHLNSLVTSIEGYNLKLGSYPAAGSNGAPICITNGTFGTALEFIQGGSVPFDPSGALDFTKGPNLKGTAGNCRGMYVYGLTAPTSVGMNYWLGAYMELQEDANTVTTTAAFPATATTATTPVPVVPTQACTAFTATSGAINTTSGCGFVVIK